MIELGISAVLCYQGLVASHLFDLAALYEDYPVGFSDGGKPVGDYKREFDSKSV